MKRKPAHFEPSARELAGPRYWRSLDELSEAPGFKEQMAREFPEGASELNAVDRRHFVKIMAASFALGGIGLSGCRRPEENIPSVRQIGRGLGPRTSPLLRDRHADAALGGPADRRDAPGTPDEA